MMTFCVKVWLVARDVFLHLEELVGQDDAVGILLAVDGLVFQRGVQFAERHRHRVRF
jgi:hypothetical protein